MTLIRIRLGDAFYFLIDCFLEGIRSGGGGRFFLFFFFFWGGGGGGQGQFVKKNPGLKCLLSKDIQKPPKHYDAGTCIGKVI